MSSFQIEQISQLPTTRLLEIIKICSREVCKREPKDPITMIKEWSDSDKLRRYNFTIIKRDSDYLITLSAIDENGKRYIKSGNAPYIFIEDIIQRRKEKPDRKVKQQLKKQLAQELLLELT